MRICFEAIKNVDKTFKKKKQSKRIFAMQILTMFP